ncbi:MAG: glycosyltransferase family 2 protein [Patescibacteria group bacterium]|nr:glycosyltransferase family 2 protein [Patescibacteria group bacterium]
MKPFLSVIIPAYNEAKRIIPTLVDVNRHLSKAEYSSEVIVVSDGSKDSTVEVVKKFSNLMKNLRVIDNKENHGKGWVVRQGMLESKGSWRLFTDADNSTSVDHFNKMIPYFEKGYDVVICSRDIKGAKLVPPQPWYKVLLGNLGNLFIQALVLPGIWDTQCGFKSFSEESAKKIFNLVKIDRWGFDVEALALAKKLGYKIKEIPVTWVNDPYSHVGIKGYISTLWDVVRVRWWLWGGKYNIKS